MEFHVFETDPPKERTYCIWKGVEDDNGARPQQLLGSRGGLPQSIAVTCHKVSADQDPIGRLSGQGRLMWEGEMSYDPGAAPALIQFAKDAGDEEC